MESSDSSSPNIGPQVVEVTQDQYAAALSMVRGLGRINPDSFADDLRWQMGERDSQTGEIITPSDTVTSPDQAAAIIENLQGRGMLSAETDDEGLLSWAGMPPREEGESGEAVESPGRLNRLAKKAGKVMHQAVTQAAEDIAKQSSEFAGYNTVSSVIMRGPRAKEASASAEAAKKNEKRLNLEEFEQEHSRRSKLHITEVEHPVQGARRRGERRPSIQPAAPNPGRLTDARTSASPPARTDTPGHSPRDKGLNAPSERAREEARLVQQAPETEQKPDGDIPSMEEIHFEINQRIGRAKREGRPETFTELDKRIKVEVFNELVEKLPSSKRDSFRAAFLAEFSDNTPRAT